MRAVGIGCRAGRSAAEIIALIDAARAALPDVGGDWVLASHRRKQDDAGLHQAAARFGVPLLFFSQEELMAVEARVITRSARVAALTGLPSIAEAAALAAVGPTGEVLLPRLSAAGVSCAIAGIRAE